MLLGAFLNRREFLVCDPRSNCFLFDVFLFHGYMVGYRAEHVNNNIPPLTVYATYYAIFIMQYPNRTIINAG